MLKVITIDNNLQSAGEHSVTPNFISTPGISLQKTKLS